MYYPSRFLPKLFRYLRHSSIHRYMLFDLFACRTPRGGSMTFVFRNARTALSLWIYTPLAVRGQSLTPIFPTAL